MNKPPPPSVPELAANIAAALQRFALAANDALSVARAEFDKRYQWFIGGRRVLVLGEPASGKTALRYLLQTGAPGPRDADGALMRPSKTTGVVDSIGHPVSTNVPLIETVFGLFAPPGMVKGDGSGVLFMPRDVAGELHEQWTQLVKDLRPEIVIFIVDGRASRELAFVGDDQRAPSFSEVAHNLVSSTFDLLSDPACTPKSIGVFVNFADLWNPSQDPFEDTIKRRSVEDGFLQAARAKYATHKVLLGRMQYFSTQLSIDKPAWPEVEAAFRALAAQA